MVGKSTTPDSNRSSAIVPSKRIAAAPLLDHRREPQRPDQQRFGAPLAPSPTFRRSSPRQSAQLRAQPSLEAVQVDQRTRQRVVPPPIEPLPVERAPARRLSARAASPSGPPPLDRRRRAVRTQRARPSLELPRRRLPRSSRRVAGDSSSSASRIASSITAGRQTSSCSVAEHLVVEHVHAGDQVVRADRRAALP